LPAELGFRQGQLPETREIPPYVWVHPDERMQADRNVANKVLADLSPEAQTALTKLKNHFGGGTPLADIRNKISFHYSDKDNLIEENFQRLSDTEPWDFYLTNMVFNSFYYASELVVAGSVHGGGFQGQAAKEKPPEGGFSIQTR
jgi:hypothetical protein